MQQWHAGAAAVQHTCCGSKMQSPVTIEGALAGSTVQLQHGGRLMLGWSASPARNHV